MRFLTIISVLILSLASGQFSFEKYGNIVTCEACNAATKGVQAFLRSDKVTKDIKTFFIDGCKVGSLIVGFSLHCEQFVTNISDLFLNALIHQLDRDRICDEWLNFCSRPKIQEIDLKSEVQTLLADKPEQTKDNDYINKLYSKVSG